MKQVLLFLMMTSALNAVANEKIRPMSQMHGTCLDYQLNLSQEFKLWKESPLNVSPSGNLPMKKHLRLLLDKQERFEFLVPPEKLFPVKGQSFGGVFYFQAPKGGRIRISAGSKVWTDVIDVNAKKTLGAVEFEMQTGCDRIFKAVIFELAEKTYYALQINGSAKPTVDFLITAEE